MLFPTLAPGGEQPALRFPGQTVTYTELRDAAARVAQMVAGAERVGIWALPAAETCVAVVGALLSGTVVVPLDPQAGERTLAHILSDSDPELILCPPSAQLPDTLRRPRLEVELNVAGALPLPPEPVDDQPALVIYTSGTTGPPKGVVIPRRAITSNLDALADAWEWTDRDTIVQALPLFHVHGLVLGVLGPLRRGGSICHVGRFSSGAIADALAKTAAAPGRTALLFAVPTMYHRVAGDAETDPGLCRALAGARLLVSGSAALPAYEHARIERLTGQRIVERYGMTETLMNAAVRARGERRPGYVGPPLIGVEVRLLDDDGAVIAAGDDATIGELAIRGPNLFSAYLNRPDATSAAIRDGWFHTGDLATRTAEGYIRIVGRRSTDLIKSAGFKIGAGEIEGVLLEHPRVAEAAVTGEPDPDLGERIVAWVVPEPGSAPAAAELIDHVAAALGQHKRPRAVRLLEALPRNAMGKVQKARLGE